MEERRRVLGGGGSGYLGQHLLAALAASGDVDVVFTHHREAPPTLQRLQVQYVASGLRTGVLQIKSDYCSLLAAPWFTV
uniref:NmrA-like domain-containing protein n=1 Tax=Oryza brachyantha TaxID=4533 RepID=J3KU29_ORYBR